MSSATRLTQLSHGAGCACKLSPQQLEPLLAELGQSTDAAVLVGTETADDAAVYQLTDDLAIVTSVDFFTPIVDDPLWYGRIAAANALSDIYAMAARPIFALNLVAFSLEQLGPAMLRSILHGGAELCAQAAIPIVGGHSIDDPEPKYGLAVTGTVHPDGLVRNSTARVGDELYLTKPLGAGVVSTAAKRGYASAELVERCASLMATLNRDASQQALCAAASAMTDVTGFGLLGHLHEMCTASGVAARIEASQVPAIGGVMELLEGSEPPVSGGTQRNRSYVEPSVDWHPQVGEARRWLLCDAMTSGGLLVAASSQHAPGVRIGRIEAGAAGRITVSA